MAEHVDCNWTAAAVIWRIWHGSHWRFTLYTRALLCVGQKNKNNNTAQPGEELFSSGHVCFCEGRWCPVHVELIAVLSGPSSSLSDDMQLGWVGLCWHRSADQGRVLVRRISLSACGPVVNLSWCCFLGLIVTLAWRVYKNILTVLWTESIFRTEIHSLVRRVREQMLFVFLSTEWEPTVFVVLLDVFLVVSRRHPFATWSRASESTRRRPSGLAWNHWHCKYF